MKTQETSAEALTGDEAQVAAAELSDDIGVEAHEADVAAELTDDIGAEAHETGAKALTGDEAGADTAAELNNDLSPAVTQEPMARPTYSGRGVSTVATASTTKQSTKVKTASPANACAHPYGATGWRGKVLPWWSAVYVKAAKIPPTS